jgi:hypothetical protein
MKCAVIIYHKGADKIYKSEWIEKCIASIRIQTMQEFDVFELNYGDEKTHYGSSLGKKHFFRQKLCKNHIEAMNLLIDFVFGLGYDVIFNTNLDDYYDKFRFQKQLTAIENGYQLVGSNFYYVNEDNRIIKYMDMVKCGNIELNLMRNHNVIAHPVVAMHKSFWTLKYNDLLGYEDLDLWKRAVRDGKRFTILQPYLLHYRIHNNQITKAYKGL